MNHQQTISANNYIPLSPFQQNKLAWENAIGAYVGEDPIELWYNYINWYEHNRSLDVENAYETALLKCLSMFEYMEQFKQDTRMLKLWFKYIDLKPNALNLCELLYQRNVGTKCTIFYIRWAQYFEAAGCVKQAESVFNLAFQVKAEPYEDLIAAHTKFLQSVAQNILFDNKEDGVSKKRPASQFDESPETQQSQQDEPHSYQQHHHYDNGAALHPQQQPEATHSVDATADNGYHHEPSAKRARHDLNAYNNNESPPNQIEQKFDLNNSANVISSSLYSVYGDDQSNNYTYTEPQYDPLRPILPANFVNYSANINDGWAVSLILDEPHDPNSFCNYPKAQVYPGDGTEFSPEEIRARKWTSHLEAVREQRRQAEIQRVEAAEAEARHLREQEHQRLMLEEQERLRAAADYEWHRIAEQERARIAECERRAADVERKRMEQEQKRIRNEQIQIQQQQQFEQQQQQYYQLNGYNHNSTVTTTNTTTSVIRTVNNHEVEEQIEASTIRFNTGNGQSKPKTITIKFRKDPAIAAAPQQVPSTPTQHQHPYHPQQSSTSDATLPNIASPLPTTPKVKKEKKSKQSKKQNGQHSKHSHQKLPKHEDVIAPPPQPSSDESNFSYAGSSHATPATPISTKHSRFTRINGHDEDSCSNSEFAYSTDNRNGYTPRSTKPFTHFATSNTSTPIRGAAGTAHNYINEAYAKATPQNFKILKKRESNLSYQNDDSMCSLSSTLVTEPNSFFAAEDDADLQQRRRDKALATIRTHLEKPTLDPFNSELCKAFLTKIGFPSREHSDTYKLVSQPINKLSNARMAMLANIPFQIEKEVGRGSYGSVYRATNVNTGATVALKYQKPANNWELYICTEVHRRIQNPDVISGFMDISAGIVAPNASIIVSEFSPYGSLLDINNQIRQNTTKVMHESMVMHFSSQILNIIDHLHSNKIIHADIKPDNFLLMKIPDPHSHLPSIRLIDFGCAIDMNCFEENTQFKKRIETDGFTCIEMQEGRPWSYQTDIFCIAGTIHVMLFGEYMQPAKKFGVWEIKNKLPRYLKKHIWSELFSSFLNIKDVDHLPDLLDMKAKIDHELYAMESELQKHIRTLSNILHKR